MDLHPVCGTRNYRMYELGAKRKIYQEKTQLRPSKNYTITLLLYNSFLLQN